MRGSLVDVEADEGVLSDDPQKDDVLEPVSANDGSRAREYGTPAIESVVEEIEGVRLREEVMSMSASVSGEVTGNGTVDGWDGRRPRLPTNGFKSFFPRPVRPAGERETDESWTGDDEVELAVEGEVRYDGEGEP